MYWLDTTIVAVLALGALLGALSGLLKQLARLVGLGIALVAAICLHDWAAERLQRHVLHDADPRITGLIAYVVVFLVIYLSILCATVLLERTATAARLQIANRVLGALLGTLKAALVLGAVLFGLSNYPDPRAQEVLERSQMAPFLSQSMEKLIAAIPAEYKEDLRSGLKDLKSLTP